MTTITFTHYHHIFNCLKSTNLSALSASLALKVWSYLPLFFLCMFSPTVHGLFWLLHNHWQIFLIILPLLNLDCFPISEQKHRTYRKSRTKKLGVLKSFWNQKSKGDRDRTCEQEALAGKRRVVSQEGNVSHCWTSWGRWKFTAKKKVTPCFGREQKHQKGHHRFLTWLYFPLKLRRNRGGEILWTFIILHRSLQARASLSHLIFGNSSMSILFPRVYVSKSEWESRTAVRIGPLGQYEPEKE